MKISLVKLKLLATRGKFSFAIVFLLILLLLLNFLSESLSVFENRIKLNNQEYN